MSCSSNVVFCLVGYDLCSSGRMVATFMPMYHVALWQRILTRFQIELNQKRRKWRFVIFL